MTVDLLTRACYSLIHNDAVPFLSKANCNGPSHRIWSQLDLRLELVLTKLPLAKEPQVLCGVSGKFHFIYTSCADSNQSLVRLGFNQVSTGQRAPSPGQHQQ